MTRKPLGCAFLLLVSPACYPLEQSSLVYSASQQIGVGVMAGTPETPGLVVNIGYRGLNAAYVPVAVAKNCPVSAAQQCNDITYRLLDLRARHNLGSELSSDSQTIETLRLAIARQQVERDNLSSAIEADRLLLEQIKQQEATRASLESERAALAGLTERTREQEERVGQVTSQIASLPQLEQPAAVELRHGERRQQLGRLNAALHSDVNRLDTLLRVQNSRQNDSTEDAYSVFGSFDGNANGNADGAGIQVGQIFSTGVAAQHLTRGLQASAVTTACLKAMLDLAGTIAEVRREAFVREGLVTCREGRQSDGS